jgi:hypothetical protein
VVARHIVRSQQQDGYRCGDIARPLSELVELGAAARSMLPEHEIVQSLYFEALPMRRDSIHDSHDKTLRWVFRHVSTSTRMQDPTSLHTWLKGGSGTFWISGKPGSGKSTLMKFLCSNPKTVRALNSWAGPNGCVLGNYFFWNAGTELQKSLEGLLRSLLFDIFTRCPELIPEALPELWDYRIRHGRLRLSDLNWSLPTLFDVFERLGASCSKTTQRFCLFIDGLDEYDGDHFQVVGALRRLGSNKCFKLCVASRPWNIFKDAYGGDTNQMLCIHEHNREDIHKYAQSVLDNAIPWENRPDAKTIYAWILDEIVEKAQGVFLWVALVVHSVCNGISNGDSYQLLERRIRELPSDLEQFFRQIVRTVDRRYQLRMALSFKAALGPSAHIPVLFFMFLEWCYEDPNLGPDKHLSSLQDDDVSSLCALARRKVNGWCKGLLEVHYVPSRFLCMSGRVTFLHRTVRDFLRTDEMTEYFDDALRGYTPYTTILRAYFNFIMSIRDLEPALRLMIQAAEYAPAAKLETGIFAVRTQRSIQKAAERLLVPKHCESVKDASLEVAIEHGCCQVVSHFLRAHKGKLTEKLDDYLSCALRKSACGTVDDPDMLEMVSLILSHGIQGEEDAAFRLGSCWADYLGCVGRNVSVVRDVQLIQRHKRMISFLLSRGADPNWVDNGYVAWGHLLTAMCLEHRRPEESSRFLIESAELVEVLLQAGGNVNGPWHGRQGTGGNGPGIPSLWSWYCHHIRAVTHLHSFSETHSCVRISSKITRMLLESGADVRVPWPFTISGEDLDRTFPTPVARQLVECLKAQESHGEIQQWTPPKQTSWFGWLGGFVSLFYIDRIYAMVIDQG